VYTTDRISQAMDGLCLDCIKPEGMHVSLERKESAKIILRAGSKVSTPLCLKESQWRELSTEALSSRRESDVDAVLRGLHFATQESGGIVISVMARDTVNAIEPLRQNVEGLIPLVSNISVVVFENDSRDGTRQAFYQWAEDVAGQYAVDILECEVQDCRFHEQHRDFSAEGKKPFAQTSAIGRMADFRNRMVTHILSNLRYANYTHMMVLDIDLGVSISPLGILHTLGTLPQEIVACSGRQVWPGSFGTITPPYDFSAFQPHFTEENERLIELHRKFCSLKPKGDRWRNECNAVSPMHTMMVLGEDKLSDAPYAVDSAFNGATLYPIKLVRSAGARYDGGDDGQRCEHIGFNLSMKRTMYVNPQWSMHLSPNAPGGPTGRRAAQTIHGIASSPIIGPVIFFQNVICMIMFVYAVITLSIKVVYPFWVKMISGASFFDVTITCEVIEQHHQSRDLSPDSGDLESLLDPDQYMAHRKRKVSDFDAPRR